MDNKVELINAFLLLSKHCEHIAKLLDTNVINEVSPKVIVPELPELPTSLDIRNIEQWPIADDRSITDWRRLSQQQTNDIGLDFSNCKILEYSDGLSIPIGHVYHNAKVELVCNKYKFGSDDPPATKIINSIEEASDSHNIGIIYESLEFAADPVSILLKVKQKIKPQGKIFIRFRPWSSRDGGFQSAYCNKAFAHLLADLEHNVLVKSKVVRPLATYDSLLSKAKLPVLSRKVKSIPPEQLITRNKEHMDVLIRRTWGTISSESAIKIMTITAIDFLVLVC